MPPKVRIDTRAIATAAKKALRDTARELNTESLRIIATPGYFKSPKDIIDTGVLESRQRVVKRSDTEYLLYNDAEQDGRQYAPYVYFGYVSTGGRFVDGRPWMGAAVLVTKPRNYFEGRLKEYMGP